MNTRINKRLLSAGFALSLGLMACQENNLVTPDKPLNESLNQAAQATNETISSNQPTMVYKLIKDGYTNLTYDSEGRLTSAVSGPDVPSNTNARSHYTYSPGAIHALVHIGSQLYRDQTFLIDAKGRCYEFTELTYNYGNSYQSKKTVMVYSYNAKGQLQTATDKSNPAIHLEYSYNADGDLFRVMHFNPTFLKKNPFGITAEYTLLYDQPTGDPLLTDQYGFQNQEVVNYPDLHLKIFGVPSKHLVKQITAKWLEGWPSKYYTYTLNADGYPTKRDEYNLSNGALVNSKSYDYLVAQFKVGLF